MAYSDLSLKLFFNKNTQKVIFAEADKQSVDFLIDSISNPHIHETKKQKMLTAMAMAMEDDYYWMPAAGNYTGNYTITDDLEVKPISSRSVLKMFGGVNICEEVDVKVVSLGMPERLMVDNVSSEGSKNVLTTVFLAK